MPTSAVTIHACAPCQMTRQRWRVRAPSEAHVADMDEEREEEAADEDLTASAGAVVGCVCVSVCVSDIFI